MASIREDSFAEWADESLDMANEMWHHCATDLNLYLAVGDNMARRIAGKSLLHRGGKPRG